MTGEICGAALFFMGSFSSVRYADVNAAPRNRAVAGNAATCRHRLTHASVWESRLYRQCRHGIQPGRLISQGLARLTQRLKSASFHHSAFTPAALIVRDHFSMSDLILAWNSSAVLPIGSEPWASSASATAFVCTSLRISAVRRATISFGVPVGASMPNHVLASNPGMPDSAIVGKAGAAALRFALLMASACRRPELT